MPSVASCHFLTCWKKTEKRHHGRRKDFFPGGGQKWWNCFFPLKTKKTPFLLKIPKSRGALVPPAPFRRPWASFRFSPKPGFLSWIEQLTSWKIAEKLNFCEQTFYKQVHDFNVSHFNQTIVSFLPVLYLAIFMTTLDSSQSWSGD